MVQRESSDQAESWHGIRIGGKGEIKNTNHIQGTQFEVSRLNTVAYYDLLHEFVWL